MDPLTDSLQYLSWANKSVDAVRSAVVEGLGVPFPAVLAQLLGLLVFITIAVMLRSAARDARLGGKRVVAGASTVGMLAAAVAAIAILAAWIDELLVPPTHQIIGSTPQSPVDDVAISLLDYRGEPLAITVHREPAAGRFLITYRPDFGDAPTAILARRPGCDASHTPLRRPHLRQAMEVEVRLECRERS